MENVASAPRTDGAEPRREVGVRVSKPEVDMREGDYEILPASEMRTKHGLTAENRPTIHLDPLRVPESLRPLIPLAERFGISDDLIRQDVVANALPAEVAAMRRAVSEHEDAMMQWLTGPAASGPAFSSEYIAFSAMLMAADAS